MTTPQVKASSSGEEGARELTLSIALPGVASLKSVELELSSEAVHLEGGGFLLAYPLPYAVDSDAAAAKFSSKTSTLRIRAPEAK